MDELGHYIRIHLTGSAGGIELFSRGEGLSGDACTIVAAIRAELVDERTQLLAMAERMDVRPAPLMATAAKVAERIGRLKPNGHPLRRTAMTDLIDLEAMRVAVAGKLAGWESLLSVAHRHEGLDEVELSALLAQARRQHEQLTDLHTSAAERALHG